MKAIPLPTYRVLHDGRAFTVMFWRWKRVPFCTHRVMIDGIFHDWLADTHPPSGKAAIFFVEKFLNNQTRTQFANRNWPGHDNSFTCPVCRTSHPPKP